jgi:hypothetical protein
MGAPSKDPVRALFICQFNRRRSATAERVFAQDRTLDVRSAGTNDEALVRINERFRVPRSRFPFSVFRSSFPFPVPRSPFPVPRSPFPDPRSPFPDS